MGKIRVSALTKPVGEGEDDEAKKTHKKNQDNRLYKQCGKQYYKLKREQQPLSFSVALLMKLKKW